jgi:hypothetical protein
VLSGRDAFSAVSFVLFAFAGYQGYDVAPSVKEVQKGKLLAFARNELAVD